MCFQHSHCCRHPETQLEPHSCSLRAAEDSPACSVGAAVFALSSSTAHVATLASVALSPAKDTPGCLPRQWGELPSSASLNKRS